MAGKRNSGRIRKIVHCVQIFTVQRQIVRVRWFTGEIIKHCCKVSERGFTFNYIILKNIGTKRLFRLYYSY